MLKILVLIVSSVVFAFAKDIPIQQKIEVVMPLKQSFVLEFPFKIEVKKTPFYSTKIEKEEEESNKIIPKVVKPDMDGNVVVPVVAPVPNKENTLKNFTLSASDNIVELFARKEGKTEIIIWGYSEYPIMISITTKDTEEIEDRYLKFVDYKIETKEAKKYESGSHEKVLIRLLKALNDGNVPTGFKAEIENLSYENDGLYYQLNSRITGYDYVSENWIIENKGEEPVSLYEEMFAENDIYLVAIENSKIKKGESTRLFIIRGAE